MKLAKSCVINPSPSVSLVLGHLTYAAWKLWNVANHERKTWTGESGTPYPDWFKQKKRLKDHFWYKNLPSQSAQDLLHTLDGAWKVLVNKTFGCVRFVYNKMLANRKEIYEQFKDDKEALKQQKYPLPADFKKEFEWLKEADSLALANAQLNLRQAEAKLKKAQRKLSRCELSSLVVITEKEIGVRGI